VSDVRRLQALLSLSSEHVRTRFVAPGRVGVTAVAFSWGWRQVFKNIFAKKLALRFFLFCQKLALRFFKKFRQNNIFKIFSPKLFVEKWRLEPKIAASLFKILILTLEKREFFDTVAPRLRH
jgi:hypothetical protein